MLAAQTFAGPGESHGLPPDEKRNPLSIEDVSERAVRLINGARERADVPLLKESEVLRQVARRLAPEKDLLEGSLKRETGLLDALEPGQRGRWRSISAVAGACSGCGAVPTASDLRWFLDQRLENPQHRSSLLESTLTHAGVWIAADGQGAKLAILVLGVIAAR